MRQAEKTRFWAKLMHWGGKTGCHQLASRSFFWQGKYQFPLCARCTGALLGGIAALLTAPLLRPRLWYAALLAPMAADGLSQQLGARTSNNRLRLATGLLGGFGYTSAMLAVLCTVVRALRKR